MVIICTVDSQNLIIMKELGIREIPQKSQKETAKHLVFGIIVVYVVVVSIFFLLFSFSENFRFQVYQTLLMSKESGRQLLKFLLRGSIMGPILIGLLGFSFIMVGFDIFVFDILVGFLITPYYHALTLVFTVKITSK